MSLIRIIESRHDHTYNGKSAKAAAAVAAAGTGQTRTEQSDDWRRPDGGGAFVVVEEELRRVRKKKRVRKRSDADFWNSLATCLARFPDAVALAATDVDIPVVVSASAKRKKKKRKKRESNSAHGKFTSLSSSLPTAFSYLGVTVLRNKTATTDLQRQNLVPIPPRPVRIQSALVPDPATMAKLAVFLVAFAVLRVRSQLINDSDVGFPELERGDHHDKSARVPLYIPGMCPENQLLYPGDQNTDWICDCQPSHVYYAVEDRCFPAYRKGPCQQNEYLILKQGEFNPVCVTNPCKEDGMVSYQGSCYKLNEPGKPCKPILEGGGIFGVNSSTLELECLHGLSKLALLQVPGNCPPGSQRDRANRCRQKY